ncbi:hypothetical protein GJ496_010859 [Pomphorhynchus laevis]|nr:hypothetical protein GJ496_010859 [Pomphorhynchus laevis]
MFLCNTCRIIFMSEEHKCRKEFHELIKSMVDQDKSTRHSAVKMLQRMVSQLTDFTKDEILDIWRGLFQCYWMCDKMLSQETLCSRICELAEEFTNPQYSYWYLQSGFRTLTREWHCIDKWRYSKYLMLLRFLLRKYFIILDKQQWNKSDTRSFTRFLTNELLTENIDKCPTAVSFQICSIYCEELSIAAGSSLKRSTVNGLLLPFCKVISTAKSSTYLKHISDEVFNVIVEASFACLSIDNNNGADNLTFRPKYSGFKLSKQEIKLLRQGINLSDSESANLKISYSGIAKRLFKFGSKPECPQLNRKIIYKLSERFDFLNNGIHPDAIKYKPEAVVPKRMRLHSQLRSIKSLRSRYNQAVGK